MEDRRPPEKKDASPLAARPQYRPPRVILYSEAELLRKLGPARACGSFSPWGSPGKQEFDYEV